MKKKGKKKLRLDPKTVASLEKESLARAAGGMMCRVSSDGGEGGSYPSGGSTSTQSSDPTLPAGIGSTCQGLTLNCSSH